MAAVTRGLAGHALVLPAAAQQVAAKHWRESQGHYGARRQRHYEGNAERYEHPALHAREEEQRKEGRRDDERGVEDGHAHLGRGVNTHSFNG